MARWDDVDDLCRRLPDARLAAAHEGSPAWYAGRHAFARRRLVEGLPGGPADAVQVWSRDLDLAQQLAPREATFPVVHTYTYRVSVWCVLARLGRRELAELVLDSYRVRGGSRRADAVDEAAYFAPSS